MRRLIASIAFLSVLGAVCGANAANKLVNGNFEGTVGVPYYDGSDPTVADDVAGWELFLGSDFEGSYAGIYDFSNKIFDSAAGPSDGGIKTAADSLVRVAPGLPYVASVTFDYYFAPSGSQFQIDWFESDGDPISSTGGPAIDLNGPFVFTPKTQKLELTGIAPPGAFLAGVRFTSGSNYAGVEADNFSFVPEPGTIVLSFIALCGMVAAGRRRG